jgi:hypothetical protein
MTITNDPSDNIQDTVREADGSTYEKFRIHVPNPDTELVLGEGDNNFIGIMGRVANGGIFFAAGGFPLGTPWGDSNYAGFKKAHTALNISIAGIAGAALLARIGYMKTEVNLFDAVTNGLAFALPTALGIGFAVEGDGTPGAAGNISLYADKSIAAAAPLTFGASAGVAASLNGGLFASVNAIVAASTNAIANTVFGVYSVTVSGGKATVVGDSELTLASRKGKTSVEGSLVEIGKPSSIATPGVAYSGFLTGGQHATERVDVRADNGIALGTGTAAEAEQGGAKLELTKKYLRSESDAGSLTFDDKGATLVAGKALVAARESGLKFVWAAQNITQMVSTARKTAYRTWRTARTTFDTADLAAEAFFVSVLTQILAGTAAGIGAGVAAGAALDTGSEAGDNAASAGIGIGSGIVGAALGGVTAFGIVKLIENRLTAKASKLAKKAADTAYKTACQVNSTLEGNAVALQGGLPTNPKVELNAKGVTLSMGLAKITITKSGDIELTSAPTGKVKINGHVFEKGVVPVFTVSK